jgi:hypothetical protein
LVRLVKRRTHAGASLAIERRRVRHSPFCLNTNEVPGAPNVFSSQRFKLETVSRASIATYALLLLGNLTLTKTSSSSSSSASSSALSSPVTSAQRGRTTPLLTLTILISKYSGRFLQRARFICMRSFFMRHPRARGQPYILKRFNFIEH